MLLTRKVFFAFFVTTLSISSVYAGHKESQKPEALAIDSACTGDAATAQCGSEKVGTGLLRCLHTYKKSNPGYKFTDGCKAAMKVGRADRKEHQAQKAASGATNAATPASP